jgi:molybdenum cofactor synthesis domain-containing protein
MKAQLLTIGTEITSGEVVNSNASWVSLRLEELGVRVMSHLSVRDKKQELLGALRWIDADIVIVTGGLGPTTDDITRECMAEYFGQPLEFDQKVWEQLEAVYKKRGLPLREAHRHQCHFPKDSELLPNSNGTALGFYFKLQARHFFVLPGPPGELEAMWKLEVAQRLKKIVPREPYSWKKWTFFAIPESEVAELVEKVIEGTGIEVGYRAQVPYVRVKLFANPETHASVLKEMDNLLGPSQIPDGADLAEELLKLWPEELVKISDTVSEGVLAPRLFRARHLLLQKRVKAARIQYSTVGLTSESSATPAGLKILMDGDGFFVTLETPNVNFSERRILPYKIPLDTERGRRYAAETALWLSVQALRRL